MQRKQRHQWSRQWWDSQKIFISFKVAAPGRAARSDSQMQVQRAHGDIYSNWPLQQFLLGKHPAQATRKRILMMRFVLSGQICAPYLMKSTLAHKMCNAVQLFLSM